MPLSGDETETKPASRRPGALRRQGAAGEGGGRRWWNEPRSAVLIILGSVVVIGGSRRLLQTWKARGAVGRLDDANVSPEAIAAVVEYGRAGLMDLFRLLGTGPSEAVRHAAGQALSVLWARDELIGEEEKALVRRGFHADWRARKRYPRGLRSEIPVSLRFGVPFLNEFGPGVRPSNLEWSYRVAGARRASLETFSPWTPGPGRADFTVVPADFETDGPHRLVFQTRVRTTGLTESWELELPHIPFSFEFDPRLDVDALFTLPDEARAASFAERVRLVATKTEEGVEPRFLPLNEAMAVRDAPVLEVVSPLPCDLAHAVEVTFDGVPGSFRAGDLVVNGQAGSLRVPLDAISPIPREAIDRPGRRRMRVRLVADADRGWADPDVRSVWPGSIETSWVEVDVVRR